MQPNTLCEICCGHMLQVFFGVLFTMLILSKSAMEFDRGVQAAKAARYFASTLLRIAEKTSRPP